jgi:hypothetical protein
MTWYVKVRGSDQKVTGIQSDDWKHALERVAELRSSGREAWIEDVDGRKIDETTGQVR